MRNLLSLPLIVCMVFGYGSIVLAQQATPDLAGLLALPGRATEKEVADYVADNKSILTQNPLGGPSLVASVKALVLADRSLVDGLIALAGRANRSQAIAIGNGIGQALKLIKPFDAAWADQTAKKIALGTNGDLIAGYAIGVGEVPTLQARAGGGLGAFTFSTSIGASPASNPYAGFATLNTTSPVTTFTGSSSVNTTSITLGGTTVVCVLSVSPIRRC